MSLLSLHRRIAILGLLAAACRGGGPHVEVPPPTPAPGDTTCMLANGRTVARDTVSVAVSDPVAAAHAPLPRNEAERLVFGQLYESLIRLDCQGRPLPGLAKSWDQASGDRWAFTLRDNARFWDGAPVTARDVLASWRGRDPALAQSALIVDDHTLTVPGAGVPFQRFADQVLAVTKGAPGGGWPIGTGGYWMTHSNPASPDELVAQPIRPTPGRPALKIVMAAPTASRDALDAGADLLVTDDPATLEYARTLAGYTDLPLDWSRTYVLLAPGRDKALAGDLRLETLQEAVRRDARPAEWSGNGHYWFSDLSSCGLLPVRDTVGAAGRRRRIVYNQSDRSAADVAARLVGLGALGRGAVAAGVPPAAFESSLRAGGDAAYVLELPRRVYDACRAAVGLPSWGAAGTVEPLLDVRAHAIVRRGLPRMALDWDGTLRLAPP